MFYVGSIPFLPGGLLPGAILAAGPRGYWKLDEGAGTTAFDSSGFAHHGTYQSGVVLGQAPGPYGAHPDFAQSGDGVIVADDADWTPGPSDPITVVGLVSETNQGGAVTSLSIAQKIDEWNAANSSLHHATAVRDTTTSSIYRLVEVLGSDVADVEDQWYLVIMEIPQSDALSVWVDGAGPLGGAVLGPTGSPATNQITDLVLGQTSTTTGGTGRHLAHVAVYRGALTTPQFDAIVDAAIADGWI